MSHMKQYTAEEAIEKLVRRHGYNVHHRYDGCDGCHRADALSFLASLHPSPSDAGVLAEWVLSEGFLG